MKITSTVFIKAFFCTYLTYGLLNQSLFSSYSSAQVIPLNDVCINASPFPIGSTIYINSTNRTTQSDFNATNTCIRISENGYQYFSYGAWYTFVGTGGRFFIRSSYCSHSYISIFTGGCRLPTRTCVAATAYPCERSLFDTVVGTTYHVLLQGHDDYNSRVDLTIVEQPESQNDECNKAAPFTLGSTINENITYAAKQSDFNASSSCIKTNDNYFQSDLPGAWYTIVGTGGRLVARSCNRTYTYISIFTGGCVSTTRTCVAATAYPCVRDRFMFDTVDGMSYYVLVQSPHDIIDLSIFARPLYPSDFCSSAQPFPLRSTITTNTALATTNNSTAFPNCTDTNNPYTPVFWVQRTPGIWFNVTGTGGPIAVRVQSCNSYVTRYVTIFSGSCGRSTLQCNGSTKDPCDSSDPPLIDSIAGNPYYVFVQTSNEYSMDLFIFDVVENDVCINAIPLSLGTPAAVNLTRALIDNNLNFDQCRRGDYLLPYPGMWYSFVGTGGTMEVDPCGSLNINDQVHVTLFIGDCESSLVCVAARKIDCGRIFLIFNTTLGTTFKLLVQSPLISAFELVVIPLKAVENDICTNAIPLTLGASVAVDLTRALPDNDKVLDNCAGFSLLFNPGVWYSFVGNGSRIGIDPCRGLRSNDRVHVSVYNGECESSLFCVVVGRIDCGRVQFIFDTTLGTTYHVLVQAPLVTAFEMLVFLIPSVPVPLPVPRPVPLPNAVPWPIFTSKVPTKRPTKAPTMGPTKGPTKRPTKAPTMGPTKHPVAVIVPARAAPRPVPIPIPVPTKAPTKRPTKAPTKRPTKAPTNRPTKAPTMGPTKHPVAVLVPGAAPRPVPLPIPVPLPLPIPAPLTIPVLLNDVCINASPFTIGSTILVDIKNAAPQSDFDEFEQCIEFEDRNYFDWLPGAWYKVVGTGGRLFVRSCNEYYSYISIFTGGCRFPNRTCVAATARPCETSPYQPFMFNTVAGTTYHVLLQSLLSAGIVDLSIVAQPASQNDECHKATPFTLGSTININKTYAAIQNNLNTSNACVNYFGSPYQSYFTGAWYTIVGTGGRHVARSCNDARTYISIFTGGCETTTRTCVTATTNPCVRERFMFDTVVGATYYVLIQSYYDVILDLSMFARPLYPSDFCNTAQLFPLRSTILTNTTLSAINNSTEFPDCMDIRLPLSPGVWFNFTGTGGRIVAKSCTFLKDTSIIIFSGSCGRSTLQCVTSSTNTCDNTNPILFDSVAGTSYLVFVQTSYEGDLDLLIFDVVENDLCINGISLILGTSVAVNLTRALPDNGTVVDDCEGLSLLFNPGMWYSFLGTGGPVEVNPCGGLKNNDQVHVSLYTGDCESSLVCAAARKIDCGRVQFIFNTTVGATYHVLIQAPLMKLFEFAIRAVPVPVPIPVPIPVPAPVLRPPLVIIVAVVSRDPHIITLDGFKYDCQARGEFTMLKSLDSTFHIQGRFTKASTAGAAASASVTSGVAIQETGASKIQISYESKQSSTVQGCLNLVKFYENGTLKPLISGTNYTNVSISVVNNEEIVILYKSGLEVHIIVRVSASWGCFFTQWIALPGNYKPNERLTGLMGNGNGNPFDDWQTKAGVTLPTPDSNAALFQGGYDYCRTEWCLRNSAESLFTYSNTESFTSYSECDVPYNPALENAVTAPPPELAAVCGTNMECLIEGAAGTVVDAQSFLSEVKMIETVLDERNITYNFNPTKAPTKFPTLAPTKLPTLAPVRPACGIFGLSIFCPFQFRGIFGRFIRNLFGWD